MADFAGQEVDYYNFEFGWRAEQLIGAGAGVADSLMGLIGVAQYSMNAVDVGFDRRVLFFDPFATNDAANRELFALIAADGAPLVQHVELVGPGVVRVYADAAFVASREYTVAVSTSLVSEDGEAFNDDGNADTFVAFARGTTPGVRDVGELRTDLLNRHQSDEISGSLEYDATGDLANESGVSYLRKRVLRRLTTVAGGFFHLPDYGVAQKLKGRITPTRVREIEKRAESQALREPDIRRVKVSASLSGSVLTLTAKVTSVDGTIIPVSTSVDLEN